MRRAAAVAALALLATACATPTPNGVDAENLRTTTTPPFVGLIEELRDDVDEDQGAQLDAILRQTEELGFGAAIDDVPRDQLACVDRLGAEADLDFTSMLIEAGGADQRRTLMEILFECIPEFDEVTGVGSSFAAGLDPGGSVGITDSQGSCVLRYILDTSPDPVGTLLEADSEADLVILGGAVEACLSTSQLDILYGVEGTGPQQYGDNPRLDRMYSECEAGDDRVCDLLYFNSNAGSDYSALTDDCAGRGLLDSGFCSPGISVGSEGIAVLDDLAAMSDECQAGDNTACDLLFMLAPIGSDAEEVGFTCGGRMVIGAVPDCRTRLG